MSRLAWIVWIVVVGCGSKPPADVHVKVTCAADRVRDLVVPVAPIKLDAAICDRAWDTLEVDTGVRVDSLRAIAGREVWARAIDHRVVIEARTNGAVTQTIAGVTAIAWHDPIVAAPEVGLAITTADGTRTVPLDELKHLGDGKEVSLCAVADHYGDKPLKIEVGGETPTPLTFTREDCATRALVLRMGDRGEIRLRSGSGERLLQKVRYISI